jgi:hypothetical protein
VAEKPKEEAVQILTESSHDKPAAP